MLSRLLEQFNTLREVVFDSNKKAADGTAQLQQLLATEVGRSKSIPTFFSIYFEGNKYSYGICSKKEM